MPSAVAAGVRRAVRLAPDEALRARPVGGGCINQGVQLRTSSGAYFLKWNRDAGPHFFDAEADGLAALAATGAVGTPEVAARSGPGEAVPWLLLSWVEAGRPGREGWSRLGRQLAELHRGRHAAPHGNAAASPPAPAPPSGAAAPSDRWAGRYGWHADNVIGSLPQANGWTRSWPDFWARRRLRPLVRSLRAAGALSARQAAVVDAAADSMADLAGPAANADGPSLLHGDLWSGNVLFDGAENPVLIDPAVYVGHREVDLAMARLFGGFGTAFYRAYEEAWPLRPGHEARRSAYQLYPLLVHARLFGGGYASRAVAAAEAVRAAATA